jgi:hypothetical protein
VFALRVVLLQLYCQNPAFGFSLFRLVMQRMLENERRGRPREGGQLS